MNECIEGTISSNNQGISRSCLLHMVMMERNSIQVPLSLSQNLGRGVSGRKTAGSIVMGGRIRCISTMSWRYCWSTLPCFTPFSLRRNTTVSLEKSCTASKRLPRSWNRGGVSPGEQVVGNFMAEVEAGFVIGQGPTHGTQDIAHGCAKTSHRPQKNHLRMLH